MEEKSEWKDFSFFLGEGGGGWRGMGRGKGWRGSRFSSCIANGN